MKAVASRIQAEAKRVARRQKKSASFDQVVLAVSMERHFQWPKLIGHHLGPTKGRTVPVHDHANAISGSVKGRKRKVPRLTAD